MLKLWRIMYEFQTGQWRSGATPSELIVASTKQEAIAKCEEKHPNCEWYGGSEVTVQGYNIVALPEGESMSIEESSEPSKFLKVYTGVTSGSMAGRDDGFPEDKFILYDSIGEVSKGFGKQKSERFYRLKEVDTETLKKEVAKELERQKEEEKQKKKASLEEQILRLQNQLKSLG